VPCLPVERELTEAEILEDQLQENLLRVDLSPIETALGLERLRELKGISGEALAAAVSVCGGVYLVPAFVGLGAPWWDAEARGSITGLTRGSGPAELARAEGVTESSGGQNLLRMPLTWT